MADEFFTRTPSAQPSAPRGGSGGKGLAFAIVLAFLLGAGGVGYLAWAGLLLQHPTVTAPQITKTITPVAAPDTSNAADQAVAIKQSALDVRLAALEQRLTHIDLRTEAAAGNSARAEGLLVALAARRALDRGVPLGLLEDQLRLRFADAQPRAVETLIETGRKPVTKDQLLAGLDALSPSLSATPAAQLGTWQRISNELASLFVVRHETSPSPAPANRLDRARYALEAGRISDAIAEVQRLPGAADAADWIAEARRYGAARDALDLIETTALLDTQSLRDGAGKPVQQSTPVASATPAR
ncbi:MAG: hypothetical protein RLZZ136_980 [Pseudomonadota bacterium]